LFSPQPKLPWRILAMADVYNGKSVMGLFRLACIAAVGVALLPSDREQQEKLYKHAASATSWVVTFCDRNAKTCTQGGDLWTAFLAKAEFGAKLAFDMIRDGEDTKVTAYQADGGTSLSQPAGLALERRSQTLTGEDLKPAWRGQSISVSPAAKKTQRGSI
jgi:hypothetical protein